MPTGALSITASLAGISIQNTVQRTADGQFSHEVAVVAGQAGTLTTRTDDDTGVATLTTGHGVVTSDRVDVYFTGGKRRGMTATVSVDAVTIDGGAGDALPAQDEAVTVSVCTAIDTQFDGDDVEMIVLALTQIGQVVFEDTGAAEILALDLTTAAEPYQWYSGTTNPLTGNPVETIYVSTSYTTAAATLKLAALRLDRLTSEYQQPPAGPDADRAPAGKSTNTTNPKPTCSNSTTPAATPTTWPSTTAP